MRFATELSVKLTLSPRHTELSTATTLVAVVLGIVVVSR
jgi:hypothetical protein